MLRIRSLARGQPALPGRVLRAADVGLDPVRCTAVRSGRRLDLSLKELALLETLLRADGVVVSAETLLEKVWDEHADPFTHAVLMAMSRPRRKLGDPPVIETVPTLGYRIMGNAPVLD